jgi:multidrug efflux pump subunit AcrB
VVVEAIHTRTALGGPRRIAVSEAVSSIVRPLVGSTLTPVVVFIPLAFLSDITGVFFRALALTMVVSLLTSLVLALTLTPSLAARFVRPPRDTREHDARHEEEGGFVLRRVIAIYERALSVALRHRFVTMGLCLLILAAGVSLHAFGERVPAPAGEGGFVIVILHGAGDESSGDGPCHRQAEKILLSDSRGRKRPRDGPAPAGAAISEPHVGDFLVKLGRTAPDHGRRDLRLETEVE